jgi:hypothetical protein
MKPDIRHNAAFFAAIRLACPLPRFGMARCGCILALFALSV